MLDDIESQREAGVTDEGPQQDLITLGVRWPGCLACERALRYVGMMVVKNMPSFK